MRTAKIINIQDLSDSIRSFIIEKPSEFSFSPGQAASISVSSTSSSIDLTIVSLPSDPYLEFIVKNYPERAKTPKLFSLSPGDFVFISEPFGNFDYKGAGTFIAGGTGITPFLSMLRHEKSQNSTQTHNLILSAKTSQDIINKDELETLFDEVFITLTQEKFSQYNYGRLTSQDLADNISSGTIYICGPMLFVVEIKKILDNLGISPERIVAGF